MEKEDNVPVVGRTCNIEIKLLFGCATFLSPHFIPCAFLRDKTHPAPFPLTYCFRGWMTKVRFGMVPIRVL